MTLAARIDEAVRANGINKAELARRIGCDRQDISRLQSGRVKDSKWIPAIAGELKVSVEWLTTGSQAHAPAWAILDATGNVALAQVQAQLARARELNGKLAEQLDAALTEIARLKNAQGPQSGGAAPVSPESEEAWSQRADRDLDQVRQPTEPDPVSLPPERRAEMLRRLNLLENEDPEHAQPPTVPLPGVSRRPRHTLKIAVPQPAQTPD